MKAFPSTALFAVVIIALLLAPRIEGQTAATGALTGTIEDSSGATVSDVRIKLINETTGETRETTSRADGTYLAPQLPPGSYRVEASKSGFKTLSRPAVGIHVTETSRLDLRLEVGALSQTVTVAASEVLAQTENNSLGRVVSETVVTDLPLVTRNYTQIIALSPGVITGVTDATQLGRGDGGLTSETEGQGIFVYGTRQYDNNFQMEGLPINDLMGSAGESGGVAIPNPDTIQEFKVQTGQYDSSYGRGAGANVDLITKGGSDKFHGTVFEFFRNNVLNANDFFSNLAGQKRPVLNQNQFGFTFGGPIKRDKLLFFTSYQGTRSINGVAQATTSPTTGAVGGCRVSVTGPALTNDRSAAALGTLFGGRTGALGGVAVMSDGSNINPISLKLLQMKLPDGSYVLPTPQVVNPSAPTPDSQGFSAFTRGCPFNEDQYMVNLDYLISTKSKIAGRYFQADGNDVATFPQSANVPGFPSPKKDTFIVASLAYTYVFSSNLLNEARVGYDRTVSNFKTQSPFSWSDIGVTGSPLDNNTPCIEILGSYNPCSAYREEFVANHFTFQDSLSYVTGRHSFQFGGGLTRDWSDFQNFQFNDELLFLSWPDFLLGLDGAANGTGVSNVFASVYTTGLNARDFRVLDGNLYAQDRIALTKQFNLNVGLRYERIGPFSDAGGRLANFDLNLANPNPPAGGTLQGFVASANYSGGTLPAGVIRSGNDSSIDNDGVNNWSPRLGFSWQMLPNSSRLVLRGGYGIYYSRYTGQSTFIQPAFSPPFSTIGAAIAASSPTFANPFTPPIPPLTAFPAWPAYSPTTTLSDNVINPNLRPSIVQQYSLNVQTEITHDLLLEVGFVGTRGTHLVRALAPDQGLSASPTNPVRGQTDNTLANLPLRLPIEGFGPTNIKEIDSGGSSWYNGLQVSLTKRFSYGLQFLASYTFSKVLDTDGAQTTVVADGSLTIGNQFNPKSRYGRTDYDRPQRFVLSTVYNLPGPKNRDALINYAFGGWSVAGVFTIQSGFAITLVSTNANNVFGITGDRAQLAPGCTNSQVFTPGPVKKKLDNYFNTACAGPGVPWPVIGADGIGTAFGDSGVGIGNGPDQNNWDIAIIKKSGIGRWLGEASNLEFRAEMFNAFNHTQFGNPFTDVTAANYGQIQSLSVNPRIIQFALKLNF